jgi:hypothetical protein
VTRTYDRERPSFASAVPKLLDQLEVYNLSDEMGATGEQAVLVSDMHACVIFRIP